MNEQQPENKSFDTEDVEAHRISTDLNDEAELLRQIDDVEGHGKADKAGFLEGDDVVGHIQPPRDADGEGQHGMSVQPPRDADNTGHQF